jgi:hypothetical protein
MLRRAWRRSRGWWLLTAAAAVSAIVGLIAQSLPVLTGSLLVGAIGGLAGIAMVHAQRAIDRGDAAPGMARKLQRVRDLHNPVSVCMRRIRMVPAVALAAGSLSCHREAGVGHGWQPARCDVGAAFPE